MCRQIERARDKGDYMRNVARQSHHAVYFSFFIVGFRKRRLSARIVRVYGGAGIGIRKAGRLRVAPRFGRRVGGGGRAAVLAGQRTYVDDAAAVRYIRQGLLATPKDSRQVDIDDLIPLLLRLLVKIVGAVGAGVVYEHVYPAVAFVHFFKSAPYARAVADIHLKHQPGTGLFGDRKSLLLFFPVGYDNRGALLGVPARDGRAHAAA